MSQTQATSFKPKSELQRLMELENALAAVHAKLDTLLARIPERPSQMAAEPRCAHRGASTGEKLACNSCQGVRLTVFECAVHGRCTVGRKADGVACCNDRGNRCVDYKPSV